MLAKIALNHYGVLHEYFTQQMKFYTIACCNISVGGQFKLIIAEKLITYEITTEKIKPLKQKTWLKKLFRRGISKKKYAEERQIAAVNLKAWTKALLSWEDADVRVVIDGTEQP